MSQPGQTVFRAAARDLVNEGGWDGNSGQIHLLLETSLPVKCAAPGVRIAKIGYFAVSQFDKVAGYLAAAVHVIVVDGIAILLGGLIVDHYNGYAKAGELAALFGADRSGADDNSIHPAFDHILNDGLLMLMILLRSGHEQAVAVGLSHFFDTLQDLAKEWVVDVADDDAQRLRTVGLQRAGSCTWTVAHF